MNYIIHNTYEVSQTQEFSVDCGDFNYLVIYGHHINGGFIAIPNWGVSVEAADPANIGYNTQKLCEKLNNPELSRTLAEAIKEHWELTEETSSNAVKSTFEPEKLDYKMLDEAIKGIDFYKTELDSPEEEKYFDYAASILKKIQQYKLKED